MSDSTTNELEELFLAALDVPEDERTAWLDRHCDDQSQRARLERLLASAKDAEDYFDALPERIGVAGIEQAADQACQAQAGDSFGPYRLTRWLGRGGMGEVWCAERADGRFESQVAVKLLTRRGNNDALQRFQREAHYLAKLSHPNIARLLDAGVGADDVPYLILEYLEGEPLDQWCDNRRLDIDARLALFLSVTDAVAHAHSRLIVHSDIKPSNVLVTGEGTVKLLDFGIATLLDDELETIGGYPLTPDYASPEQLNGNIVSTATDVYSLGLLLYHLLAGSNPRRFDKTMSLDELRRAVTISTPPLASTVTGGVSHSMTDFHALAVERGLSPHRLLRILRGEIEPIVQKALALEQDERYRGVSELADDLRRYLANKPVSVIPNTLTYRARKFTERHRGGVLAATLTLLALVTATAVTTWQAAEARRQRDVAIQQQERAMATNEFLNILLGELDPSGKTPSLEKLLERGVTIIETQFGDSSRTTSQTLFELSALYGRLGALDRQLALLDDSEAVAAKAGDDGLRARALCAKARLELEQDPEAAAAALAAGNDALARLPRLSRPTIPECYRAEALTQAFRGEHEAAITTYREIVDIMEAAPVSSPVLRLQLLNDLSEQYYITGRAGEALGILERTIAYHDEIGRGSTLTHLIFLANRGATLLRLGEVVGAANQLREVVERVAAMPQAPIGFRGLYAASLTRLGRYDEAIALLEKDYAASEAADNRRRLGLTALQLGDALMSVNRDTEALEFMEIADEVFSAAPGAYARESVRLALQRADLTRRQGDLHAARRDADRLLVRLGYPGDRDGIGLALVLWYAAKFALLADEPAVALGFAQAQLELVTNEAREPGASADVGRALYQRACARLALGEAGAVADDLRRAVVALGKGVGDAHTETVAAATLLAELSN